MRRASDPVAHQAALSLLARGIGTPSEIAVLAGVSRQLVESWAKSAGIDWHEIKRVRLSKIWSRELQRGFAVRHKARRRIGGVRAESGTRTS